MRRRATVLADALEAAPGARFTWMVVSSGRVDFLSGVLWGGVMERQEEPPKDAKTALQEWVQARNLGLPEYVVASRAGPPHAPAFIVTVSVSGCTGSGTAGNKRSAEQFAAEDLLRVLDS